MIRDIQNRFARIRAYTITTIQKRSLAMEQSNSESSQSMETSENVSVVTLIGETETPISALRIWSITLFAGIVTGLVSWGAGEMAQGLFKPEQYPTVIMGGTTMMLPTATSSNRAEFKNAVVANALLGGIAGMTMALAGGLVASAPFRGFFVGLGTQAVGAAAGAFSSLLLLRSFYRGYVPNVNDLISPILIHGGIWLLIGGISGVGFGFGMGNRRRLPAIIGGAILGGLFSSILYETIVASFFPDSQPTGPIAGSPSIRLLSMLSVTFMIALGIAKGAHGSLTRYTKPGPAV